MATSKYFNYTNHKGTQRLINDLVIEMIQQRGIDVQYIPRNIISKDPILNEADHLFDEAKEIEAYVEDYTGHNDYMWEKFGGMTMQDEAMLVFSRSRWDSIFATAPGGRNQIPQEGDLIYFPMSQQMFKVNNVNDDDDFLQFGKYYTYRLKCELYTFNNEEFDTGNDEIDSIEDRLRDLDNDGVFKDTLFETDNALAEEIQADLAPNKIKLDFGD